MFFVLVDAHSKWPEVVVMNSTTAAKTIIVLREMFSRYGLPKQLVSDNGPQFVSEEFAAFLEANGVKHIRSAPYHPSTNGAAEKMVQTLKHTLRAGNQRGLTLEQNLASFLLQYRSTPHTTTGATPSSLFLGRSLRNRLDLLRPDLGVHVRAKQAAQKEYHD